jgi:hypothetical protein
MLLRVLAQAGAAEGPVITGIVVPRPGAWPRISAIGRSPQCSGHVRGHDAVNMRLGWALISLGMAVILAVPNIAAKADFGPWHFTVTADGNREFREVYSFPSRRVCEAQRDTMQQGVARVLAEHGSTTVGRVARRLRLVPCEAIRRAR